MCYSSYTDIQAQQPQADIADDNRNELRSSQGARTRYVMSADEVASTATSSRRRKSRRRSGRRPLLPTPETVARECPWLYMSRSPHRDHSSVPSVVPSRHPPLFARHYSYPMASTSSPVKRRRCTDAHFPSSDRERRGDWPAWLSEMTPRQHRGSMSLHCCVAIVSRSLHCGSPSDE